MINTEKELVELINNLPKIYLFGAGNVSKNVIERTKHCTVNKDIVVVTTNGGDRIDKYVSKALNECADEIIKEDAIVIVCVSPIYLDEIIESLENRLIKKYILLSNKLIKNMEMMQNVSIHFETHLVDHCNLKCKGCYHFSPLSKEVFLDPEEYSRDISRLHDLFDGNITEVLLLGGEPLLHPRVDTFFDITRKYVKNGKIKILTNGLLIPSMKQSFWDSLVDNEIELYVTKYPVSFDYSNAERIAALHGVTIHYFNDEEVKTLGYQPLDTRGIHDYERNFKDCYRANECIDLKHGKIFPCIIPAEIKPFNDYFGENLELNENDYIDIYKVNSGIELLEKMQIPTPFCRYCNREHVLQCGAMPWERTHYDKKEWII